MTAAPYGWTDALVTGGWIRTLSPAALKLVLALGVHVNGSTLEAWPNLARLQELTGLVESTTRAGLAELREVGLLAIGTKPKAGRYRTYEVTVYRLLPLPPRGYASENRHHTPATGGEHAAENLDRTPPPLPLESLPPRTGKGTGQFPPAVEKETATAGTGNGELDRDVRQLVAEWLASHAGDEPLGVRAAVCARALQSVGLRTHTRQVVEIMQELQAEQEAAASG